MTATQYRRERRARGTIPDIAALVGVHVTTINKRERGEIPVNKQAELLLMSLPKLPKPVVDAKPGRPKSKG